MFLTFQCIFLDVLGYFETIFKVVFHNGDSGAFFACASIAFALLPVCPFCLMKPRILAQVQEHFFTEFSTNFLGQFFEAKPKVTCSWAVACGVKCTCSFAVINDVHFLWFVGPLVQSKTRTTGHLGMWVMKVLVMQRLIQQFLSTRVLIHSGKRARASGPLVSQ